MVQGLPDAVGSRQDERMKRVAGIALAAVLAVGVVLAVVLGSRGTQGSSVAGSGSEGSLQVARGVIGSEKKPYFDDPRVKAAFAAKGYDVQVDTAGSRQIATSVDLTKYDFAFPGSVPAADRIRRDRKVAATYSPFFSPMAIATFRPVADLLRRAGVVTDNPAGYQQFHVAKYLELVEKGTRWKDLPKNTEYPASKKLLLISTDVRSSNSAAMYLAWASYVANGENVVTTQAQAAKVLPLMSKLFLDQGYSESSSEAPFEDYLSQGIGKTPMVLVYESQFLSRQLRADGSITKDMVLLYPSPDVLSKHTVVPLKPAGDAVGKLLMQDPQLVALQAELAFRTTDRAVFARVSQQRGLNPPPDLVDVVEPPSYEVLEGMINALEKQYGS